MSLRLSIILVVAALVSLSHSQDCSVWVVVDKNADAVNCAASTSGWVNGTCSDLQDALLSMAESSTTANHSDRQCTDVLVKQGDYIVTEFISISHNLRVRGEGVVTVRFNFTGKFDPTRTNAPEYVMSFFNADHIELRGIDFIESPGIVTIFSVNTVVIEDCSFR